MRIVYLGWGSLFWDPRELPLEDGVWHEGGPVLPIEFSRVSGDGRLTLVIDEANGALVTTLFADCLHHTVVEAVAGLSEREETPKRNIGIVNLREPAGDTWGAYEAVIRAWAKKAAVDAVVWTALPPDFKKKTGEHFTVARALAYLNGLTGESKEKAVKYIEKAPPSVVTPFRTAFHRAR